VVWPGRVKQGQARYGIVAWFGPVRPGEARKGLAR